MLDFHDPQETVGAWRIKIRKLLGSIQLEDKYTVMGSSTNPRSQLFGLNLASDT